MSNFILNNTQFIDETSEKFRKLLEDRPHLMLQQPKFFREIHKLVAIEEYPEAIMYMEKLTDNIIRLYIDKTGDYSLYSIYSSCEASGDYTEWDEFRKKLNEDFLKKHFGDLI
jgi:hypothetical protein